MTVSMEWQANQLAPRMQMPARTFKVKARESITFYMREMNAKHECDVMEYVINILAESFGVSKQVAKIRLVQLGFDNAIGTYTFLDGHYVKPHGFRKGTILPTQTFSISAQDAAIERFRNPILKELTKNGDYLFIDNHFVYYAPLYVRRGEARRLELTDYARAHMEECCLLFDLSIGDRCDVDSGGLSMSHVMDKSIFYNDMLMIDRQDEYEDVCRKVYKILGRKKHWADAFVAIRLDNMSVNDYAALIGKKDASIISKWLKRAEEKLRKDYR